MLRTTAVLGLMVLCAPGAPTPTAACHNVVVYTKDDAVASVVGADRLLSRGEPRRAYIEARRARRRLEREERRHGATAETRRVLARAERIIAIAVVRLDGRTPLTRRQSRRAAGRGLAGRELRSLRWARDQLREVRAAHPQDLSARMHYAEAQARLPEGRDEARAILTDLAARDLMPDAHGYAALLLVTPRADGAWADARTRCRQIAADHADRICRPQGAVRAT